MVTATIRVSHRGLALLTALLSMLIRTLAPGWMLILGLKLLIYPIICVAHWIIHFFSLPPPVSKFQARLATTSNALLIAAFAFQIDFGDGPCGMMPITTIFWWLGLASDCPFKISERTVPWIDALLYVPVIVTWLLLVVAGLHERTKRGSG